MDRLRFFVASESDGETEYLVDLAELWGNGRCDCYHFRCRLEPRIKKHPGLALRCKHIIAARDHLADRVIASVMKEAGDLYIPPHETV